MPAPTHSDGKDRELLRRVLQDGCVASAATLYQRYKNYLGSTIRRYLDDQSADVEGLVHMVFVPLLTGQCRYRGQSHIKTYLAGIAKRVVAEHIRSRKRSAGSLALKAPQGNYLNLRNDGLTLPDPLNQVQDGEAFQRLNTAIAQLPPKQNQAVKLVYFEGIKPKNAARQLGCDPTTFRRRLADAIKRLREQCASLERP